MPTADSTVSERLLYFHSIPLPSKWEMEKELALRFLSIGVVKSALEIFERLELWEEVVKCWQAMERADKAVAIVRDLLEGRKAEADTVIRERTFPLTWIGYSTVSSTSSAGSATGKSAYASEASWPSFDHSSSARCGHSGASMSTSGSATDRGHPPSG